MNAFVKASISPVFSTSTDEIPSVRHKQHHHYTLAVIYEALRIRPAVVLGAPHASKVDAPLLGYDIPADTLILSNIWAIHMDPRYWEDPEEFRPERFLNEDGNIKRQESFIPFSFGKQCHLIFLLLSLFL